MWSSSLLGWSRLQEVGPCANHCATAWRVRITKDLVHPFLSAPRRPHLEVGSLLVTQDGSLGHPLPGQGRGAGAG